MLKSWSFICAWILRITDFEPAPLKTSINQVRILGIACAFSYSKRLEYLNDEKHDLKSPFFHEKVALGNVMAVILSIWVTLFRHLYPCVKRLGKWDRYCLKAMIINYNVQLRTGVSKQLNALFCLSESCCKAAICQERKVETSLPPSAGLQCSQVAIISQVSVFSFGMLYFAILVPFILNTWATHNHCLNNSASVILSFLACMALLCRLFHNSSSFSSFLSSMSWG